MRARVPSVLSVLALTAVLTACGSDGDRVTAAPRSTAAETSAPAAPVTAVPETPAPQPATWPAAIEPVEGSRLWGVYLAVEDLERTDGTLLRDAAAHAQSLGYGDVLGGRELSCATGAAEALGRDEADIGVAVFFDTQQGAEQFIARYDRPYVGSAQVTIRCGSPWAVYLAVEPDRGEDTDHARLSAVAEHARSLGSYEVFSGDLRCDLGAASALGLEEDLLTVVTYFNTREQAEDFIALYGRPVAGYTKVVMAPCAE